MRGRERDREKKEREGELKKTGKLERQNRKTISKKHEIETHERERESIENLRG